MLLESTNRGLYCLAGDFYIDPWQPVDCAVLTHAHSDHARFGSRKYLVAEKGLPIFRRRLGQDARIESISFGERIEHNGVTISLHPAGHILGSAQVRVEFRGEVWVVSGDYKVESDPTCDEFEAIHCHHFVTESTFGLPIYHWRPQSEIFDEINAWWRENQTLGRTSILYAYALGKSQRLLAGIDPSLGPIMVHGSVFSFLPAYKEAGVKLSECLPATDENARSGKGKALVIAPPSAEHTPWLKKFGECSTALASGWMQVRGVRRRRGVDRGFVLSDHVDWPGLLQAIKETGAETIWVTHGYADSVVRWLRENGKQAEVIAARFEPEFLDEGEDMKHPAPETGQK